MAECWRYQITYNRITFMNTTDTIAILALAVSFGALGWNIVRDLIIDRVKLDLEATAGELIPVQGIPGRFGFVDADAEPDRVIANPLIAFTVTNTGRRPVLVVRIWGTYVTPEDPGRPRFLLNTRELPKMLEPYERHVEFGHDRGLMEDIRNNNISELWVEDSKGKRWLISPKHMERLKKTVLSLNHVSLA